PDLGSLVFFAFPGIRFVLSRFSRKGVIPRYAATLLGRNARHIDGTASEIVKFQALGGEVGVRMRVVFDGVEHQPRSDRPMLIGSVVVSNSSFAESRDFIVAKRIG